MSLARRRKTQAGQGIVEVAVLLPVLLMVVLMTIDVEWSIFEVQQIQGAANGAVRAAVINGPSDVGGTCDKGNKILNAIRQAGSILPLSSGDQLCMPSSTQTDVLALQDGNITICITSYPTVYLPGHVTAVVHDHLSGLVPMPFFNIPATVTSETTTGSGGVPGTAYPSSDPACPAG